MPRYVILSHDYPFLHLDLMLEAGGVLRTWRLLQWPEPGKTIPIEPLGDHRALYLDYEGPLTEGRGTVSRWDAGTYQIRAENAGALDLHLSGTRLHGPATIRQRADNDWFFEVLPGTVHAGAGS